MGVIRIDRKYVLTAPLEDVLAKIDSVTGNHMGRISRRGDDIMICCPIHGESHPSCGIYVGDGDKTEYGHVHCFACGYNASFIKFVGDCFGSSPSDAKRWLISNFGIESSDEMSLEPIKSPRQPIRQKRREFSSNGYLDYHKYLAERGISKEICTRFSVKYDPGTDCIVFPVWDDRGNFVMETRRSVEGKRFHIDADAEKPVYLLNFIKSNGIMEAMVVESQFNALTGWQYGMPSVALFGTGTQSQYDILAKSGITHLYICLDPDNAGRKGTWKLLKALPKSIMVDVLDVPAGKDVNDLTYAEFRSLLHSPTGRYEWMRQHSSTDRKVDNSQPWH